MFQTSNTEGLYLMLCFCTHPTLNVIHVQIRIYSGETCTEGHSVSCKTALSALANIPLCLRIFVRVLFFEVGNFYLLTVQTHKKNDEVCF